MVPIHADVAMKSDSGMFNEWNEDMFLIMDLTHNTLYVHFPCVLVPCVLIARVFGFIY